MKKTDFVEELIEIMEREEAISEDMLLDDIEEWDSLARITFLSFLEFEFGLTVASDDVKKCIKVSDLMDFVIGKLSD